MKGSLKVLSMKCAFEADDEGQCLSHRRCVENTSLKTIRIAFAHTVVAGHRTILELQG
jgi:hypothetical protein